jgi:transcription initiation factor TFIIB
LAIEGKWFPTFTEPVVCAIIFEGCKRGGESRNMKEIGRLSGKKTVFNRQLAMVNKKLTSGSQGDIDTNTGASRATFAKDLMPRYCQEIGLPVWAETLAVQVAEAVNDTLILGSRTARNVAASVIYLVCHLIGQPRTVTEIYSLAEQVKGKYSPINMIPI